jgi:hypothetical protein
METLAIDFNVKDKQGNGSDLFDKMDSIQITFSFCSQLK